MKEKLFIIVIIILIGCLVLVIICDINNNNNNNNKNNDNNNDEELIAGRYILVNKLSGRMGRFSMLAYDKDTYVMYIFYDNIILPYYIVKDEEVIVAIYNVNWFAK